MIELYTDASIIFATDKPNGSGWAFVLVSGDRIVRQSSRSDEKSINRLEMEAVWRGLSTIGEPSEVRVYTDSLHVMRYSQKVEFVQVLKSSPIPCHREAHNLARIAAGLTCGPAPEAAR